MNGSDDTEYYLERAAEERRIASELPEGPAARAHQKLAELYEMASRNSLNGRQILHIPTANAPGLRKSRRRPGADIHG